MQLLTLLTSLETLEREMADLYGWLAERFEDDSEASGLFFQLSLQERNHVNLVRFGRTLVHRAPRDFEVASVDDTEVLRLVDHVRAFRRDVGEPALADAIRFALDVEGDPLERLHRDIMSEVGSEVGRMMAQLATDDRQHFERLEAFASERGLLPGDRP